MKNLSQILDQIDHQLVTGDYLRLISGVEIDSRLIKEQGLFIAIEGTVSDGHEFIGSALANGATAIICNRLPGELVDGITYIMVENTRMVVGFLAANFYDHPSKKLKLVGVTGTNGKTSFVQLAQRLFSLLGHKSGMLSTIENKIDRQVLSASLTTPDAISLQKILAEMVRSECTHVFMEVSSHALDQGRVSGCHFQAAVFTNLTHDHLDYHGTFDHYIKSKKLFFDRLENDAHALINIDDRHGQVMVQNTQAKVHTYALRKAASFKGKIIDNSAHGLHLQIDGTEMHSALVGAFNASNLLAVYAVARILGQDKLDVLQNLSGLAAPAGRMEVVRDQSRQVTAFVDYAHTPDALKNVLETIVEIKQRGQQVVTVVGCGGNRDALKRPVMAKLAVQYSDRVILTSDNPRFEDPEQIIKDMENGIPSGEMYKVLSITNRREAIKVAIAIIDEGGIILVAGKGHENYQDIQGIKKPFDDREVLKECFTIRKS
ncbi:MAG: UDP-N-acetylmuramoyl-L-alanyl-D-glutamate--2,6-diaminopimelate ligase [Saprospiraceae bacterium]|nr:UDP-N-acetylmuramoyl-L-alanyl-D-glutamate--2,6-diaminopimelate ligase [Saprospiraceae bacterium]